VRILVVDDDRLERMLLRDHLAAWGHDVVTAENGVEALRRLGSDPVIALVITDWVMPGMDGPELCRRIRAREREPYLPIIVSTSQSQLEHMVAALAAGADALLPKPFHPGALRAQMGVVQRILRLEEGLRCRVRALEEANEHIHRDLEAAAAIQRAHLPSHPPRAPHVEFAWVYSACRTLGGDMFNVFRLDERTLGTYVLDVAGHGTPAALLSVSLSRALVPSPQQGGILKRLLPEPPYYEVVPPAEVARELNRRFRLMEQSGRYCTLLYGVLDLETHEFRYVSAGHPGPVELTAGCAKAHEEGGDIPVGVAADAAYSEQSLALGSGSQLFLYTDGLSEAMSRRRELFGAERMRAALERAAREASGVQGSVQALCDELLDFTDGQRQRDDVTLVGIGVL